MKNSTKPFPRLKAYMDSMTVHADVGGMEYNATNQVCTIANLGSAELMKRFALLFAAAPDLLEALIEIERRFNSPTARGQLNFGIPTLARDAIAKATRERKP